MATWNSVVAPWGEYISKVYNVSTGHNTVFGNVEMNNTNKHDQDLRYYYRFSQDNQTWQEWLPLLEGNSNLFEGYDASIMHFQYKVIMSATQLDFTPTHKELKITFYPYELVWNVGDLKGYPKLWFTKRNKAGTIQLINTTNKQVLEFKDLKKDEEVFIDTYDEIIKSSHESTGTYRYDDHNNVWLVLEAGENLLDSKGDYDLDIRYYSPLLQD